ncbi:hypothetical protein VA602_03700 [Pseudomonas sp. MH2]|uniref:Uncharacterized protein n=1 Tax=Pseudomonas machongensis TaxID=3110229 RepID=A0ABU5VEH6_9PSED|nr:hypothetical protein [Pseudomonas sp. MH2]MEA5670440.1 hypothetical protein [Pseudomonas sp. MH2]
MKHTITIDIGVDVVDIPTMQSMPNPEYLGYIENSLFWVDHHDVLRATHGEYPIATTSEQVELLINHLKIVADGMRRAGV